MKNYTFPRWSDLPEIDLYMDQVITYINEKLKDTYFYDEKFITKAMINNYVKTGIVHPPVKKTPLSSKIHKPSHPKNRYTN